LVNLFRKILKIQT